MRWSVSMVHTWLLVFHQLFCCPVPYKAQPSPVSAHYWLAGTQNTFSFFCPTPPPPSSCSFVRSSAWKVKKRYSLVKKSSQILALPHQCLQTLFYRFWIELWTFWRGSSWNDFILDCARHYMRSILLLYCVDVGLQSLQHSSCKQYLGVISPLSSVFLNIVSFTDDRAFSRKWNQTSPKSAKKPHLLLPPLPPLLSSGLLSVLFFLSYFSHLSKGSISFCSLSLSEGMQYTVGPQFIDMNLLTFLCMYYNITVNDW